MKIRIYGLIAAMVVSVSQSNAEESPTIAFLRLERQGVTVLEAAVVTNLIRTSLVNSGTFVILDRENMDKILQEQSIQDWSLLSDSTAVRMGKILNVEKICVGTLMRFEREYYCELRIIDIETSCIEKSTTQRCSTRTEFDLLARNSVARLCAPRSAVSSDFDFTGDEKDRRARLDYSGPKPDSDMSERWVEIGMNRADYYRFESSERTLSEWIAQERKSKPVAGLIAVIPGVSGFYYTRSYGTAAFVSMAEILAVAGMIPGSRKGGEEWNIGWLYPVVLSVATVFDIGGSLYAAGGYNTRLDRLATIESSISMNSDLKQITTAMNIQF
jgi:hypothetical protein